MDTISAERIRAWLPRMLRAFDQSALDQQHGGFYERLDAQGTPLDLPYRRTLVQCRQCFVHAQLALLDAEAEWAEEARVGALHAFHYLQEVCKDREHGGWFFSVGLDGKAHDDQKDAYAHAFVIFASAYMIKLGRQQADDALVQSANASAQEAWMVFDQRFRDTGGLGFHEAFTRDWQPIARVRRQNPHMHLLEALLAMADASGDAPWMMRAQGIIELFSKVFYDSSTNTLGEYFSDDWKPHKEAGQIIEPGHHFEWVWLIGWWQRLCRDQRFAMAFGGSASETRGAAPSVDDLAAGSSENENDALGFTAMLLLGFGLTHGWDREAGGVYDEVNREGEVLKESKRIWPLTEAIKALAWWIEQEPDGPGRGAFDEALELLFTRYLDEESGRWTEHLHRDLSPKVEEMPGTTGYHITLGLIEALKVLEA